MKLTTLSDTLLHTHSKYCVLGLLPDSNTHTHLCKLLFHHIHNPLGCSDVPSHKFSETLCYTHTHTHTHTYTLRIIHTIHALSKTRMKFPMFIIHFHNYILINSKVKLHTH